MPNTKVCRGCGDKVSTFKTDKLLTRSSTENLPCLRCTICGVAKRSPMVAHIENKVWGTTSYKYTPYEQIAQEALLEIK